MQLHVRCYLPCVPVLLYANLLRTCLRRICCKASAIHGHADERAGCGGCKGSKRADQCFMSAVRNSQAFTTYLWAVDVRAEQVVAIEHVALGVLARTPFHSCLATCTRLTLHTTYVLLVRLVHFPTFALSVCLGICVLKCPRESQFLSRSLFSGVLSPYTKCPGGWHIAFYAVMKNTQTHFGGYCTFPRRPLSFY